MAIEAKGRVTPLKNSNFQPLWPGRLAVINAQKSAGQFDPPPMAERVKNNQSEHQRHTQGQV